MCQKHLHSLRFCIKQKKERTNKQTIKWTASLYVSVVHTDCELIWLSMWLEKGVVVSFCWDVHCESVFDLVPLVEEKKYYISCMIVCVYLFIHLFIYLFFLFKFKQKQKLRSKRRKKTDHSQKMIKKRLKKIISSFCVFFFLSISMWKGVWGKGRGDSSFLPLTLLQCVCYLFSNIQIKTQAVLDVKKKTKKEDTEGEKKEQFPSFFLIFCIYFFIFKLYYRHQVHDYH